MSSNTPKKKRRFPWWAVLYFTAFFTAGLGITLGVTLGVHGWVTMQNQLESCSSELEEVNSTLADHCIPSELRLLTCDGRVDGCLCAQITPSAVELKSKSD
jgi:hypothetical protein